MTTERTITAKAADGTLTIAELRVFVAEVDQVAESFDISAAQPTADVVASLRDQHSALKPKARVSFGGGIKSVTVTVPGSP